MREHVQRKSAEKWIFQHFPVEKSHFSLEKHHVSADQTLMDKSFHDILCAIMNDSPPHVRRENPACHFVEPPSFIWSHQPPRAPKQPQATENKGQSAKEFLIDKSSLNTEAKKALNKLLALGALEIEDGLSRPRLKKAYRRLVKWYHPDTQPEAASHLKWRQKFLDLQSSYRLLLSAIADNEFASAQASQRQDAA